MTTIQIKHRYTEAVLFEGDAGMTMRQVLEKATFAKADLRDADLRGADLRGADLGDADLRGADLRGAYLRGADLGDADLGGADLGGAYLRGAYLRGADLDGAYLSGADLDGKTLVGKRPILQIGPVGSRDDYLVVYLTNAGIYITAGCWHGTRDEFSERVRETHGENEHGREYASALALIDAHAKIWTPAI